MNRMTAVEGMWTPTCWRAMDNRSCACCDDNIPAIEDLQARVEELEAALDLALGHMRHEDDCTWTVGLRGGQGLSQGGPGVVCNCGNRDAVRRVSKLLRTDA